MTNSEKLRKQIYESSDLELAEILNDKCIHCDYHYAECEIQFCICSEGIVKWLRKEAPEDAEND